MIDLYDWFVFIDTVLDAAGINVFTLLANLIFS
jgi:hypothetical protein